MILTNEKDLAIKKTHNNNSKQILLNIYDHIGYNYRLVNVLAAIGVAQWRILKNIEK